MLRVYNTKTKKKQELNLIESDVIKMYVCGPTLYGDIHIGNARPIIFFDVVYRYLKLRKINIKYVSNITDIDDKIIDKAFELGISEEELVKINEKSFFDILHRLNIANIDQRPAVTGHIGNIISFIEGLLNNDFAYIAKNGDVYFRVSKAKDYGSISNRDLDELQAGARIDINNFKEEAEDFVLWKNTDKGITWDAPFGAGRPGWHTECAVIIRDVFGGKVNIHGGGVDLMFPHHENENAQFHVCSNEDIADIWMHNGLVNVNDEKMSKSSGNFITVKEALNKYSPNIIRLLLLQANYRQPINLCDEFIEQTKKLLNKIEGFTFNVYETDSFSPDLDKRIVEIMDDDFNVPNLLTLLLTIIKEKDVNAYLQIIEILGLKLRMCVHESDFDNELLNLIDKYYNSRENKDFDTADKIKDQIYKHGFELFLRRDGLKVKRR